MSLAALSTHSRTLLLFGASGQLGSSLTGVLRDRKVIPFAWSEAPGFLEQVLAGLRPDAAYDVVFAGGLTNPRLPEDQIRYSNFLFPQKLIEATALRDCRYLTLGTVMENFPEACAANPYLRSKLELGRWLSAKAAEPGYQGRIRHVRLHTIYGGSERRFLKPHMFLGQLGDALKAGVEFKMSSGDQLREYHHADDIAASLKSLLDREWPLPEAPILQINSGSPVRLDKLAQSIFEAFGKPALLTLGAIPRAKGENLDQVFPRSEPWLLPSSREPFSGVIAWLKSLVGDEKQPPTT